MPFPQPGHTRTRDRAAHTKSQAFFSMHTPSRTCHSACMQQEHAPSCLFTLDGQQAVQNAAARRPHAKLARQPPCAVSASLCSSSSLTPRHGRALPPARAVNEPSSSELIASSLSLLRYRVELESSLKTIRA
jgi:hypothetical protein